MLLPRLVEDYIFDLAVWWVGKGKYLYIYMSMTKRGVKKQSKSSILVESLELIVGVKGDRKQSVVEYYASLVDTEEVLEKKMALMEVDGRKNCWVKNNVMRYQRLWWAKWYEMVTGKDEADIRTAMIEYNKLQARILPAQVEDGDLGNIVVKINQFNINNEKRVIPIES